MSSWAYKDNTTSGVDKCPQLYCNVSGVSKPPYAFTIVMLCCKGAKNSWPKQDSCHQNHEITLLLHLKLGRIELTEILL